MAEKTLQEMRLERELHAATLVFDGKANEHTAACMMFDGAAVENSRLACMAALEAVLDRKQAYLQGGYLKG